jgi:ribonuclease Z
MGFRLTKAQDFFITGKTEWSNVGGLVGMALTLADSSSSAYEQAMEMYRKKAKKHTPEPTPPRLNLYGPPNLKHMLATCRRFIFRKGLPMIATEYKGADPPTKSEEGTILPSWQDDNIQVWALPITPSRISKDSGVEATLAERSRHYDDVQNQFTDNRAPEDESPHEREVRYDRIRTSILNSMFDSNWSFDTLVERHISEVEMPTTMFVRDPSTGKLRNYQGPMPGSGQPLPDITVLTRTPWPGAMVLELPPTRPAPEAVSYIVRTHKTRGKFDIKRARELKVPKGVAYSQLTKGLSVTSELGETITPDMVLGPDNPGQGVAILDVPSLAHLESLICKEELSSNDIMSGIGACVWILGPSLARHATLVRFMKKLDTIKHVISSPDESPNRLALHSVAAQTIRLNQIDPERYHIPYHDNSTVPQKSICGGSSQQEPQEANVSPADRALKLHLMPKFKITQDDVPPLLDIDSIANATSPDIIESAKAAHDSIERDQASLQAWRQLLARPDTEVITLGTGSALPSKYRNVSATLVRVPGIGNYLLDCGENTLGQLQRVFSPEELTEVLRNLRMIWISHLHADHHLGTASVIKAWYATVHKSIPASTPPSMSSITDSQSEYGLSVISHDGMLKWIHEYSFMEDFGYSRIVPLRITPYTPDGSRPSQLTLWPTHDPDSNVSSELLLKCEAYQAVLGLADIQACKVSHCHGAMAVSLTFPPSQEEAQMPPLKVSYSGDCRPSSTFADMGRDTTVLIHEATFDDELAADARAKKHSTTSEALGIGAKMGAKAVVLTHFSQRYQKIPVLETVENGDEAGRVSEAAPTAGEPLVAEEQDQEDVEMAEEDDEENVDMMTANLGNPDQASPKDTTTTVHAGASEQVIKVKARDMKVAIAFDYMRVKIGDIAKMEKFNAPLEKLLVSSEEADDGDGVVEPQQEEAEKEKINGNGKKTSPVADGGGGKKKKAKRNN